MSQSSIHSNTRQLAKTAGWFYFLIILSSILSLVFLGGNYTVMGDSASSVAKMQEYEFLVRISAVYEVLMFAAVIALSVLLFELTKRVNAAIARIAMLLRVGEAIMGYAGVALTLGILVSLEGGDADLAVSLYDLKDVFYKVLMVCISIGTILFFYLFLKAKFLPKFLCVWGFIGFGLMILASFLQILELPWGIEVNGAAAALAISFEFVVGLWLIVKGVRTE